ncbi:MAG: hypothetical protein NTX82_00340 [Candidatus Parcubacteria bacterium]|nr:hypothetical protein [Candidatus Parcubacteria bacterium]
MVRIYLEEEYGYREFLWEYPGTEEELIKWFQSLKDNPCGECICFWNPSHAVREMGMGEVWEVANIPEEVMNRMKETDWQFEVRLMEETLYNLDHHIHMHMAEDTFLEVRSKEIYIPFDPSACEDEDDLIDSEGI